jgi:hypothetical protein
MTAFYISPSCLAYKQYKNLLEACLSFGWSPSWKWPHATFHNDAYIHKSLISKALNAISRTDIFIAVVPGTASTNIEIGTAYTLCQEIFLVAKDPVHLPRPVLLMPIFPFCPA